MFRKAEITDSDGVEKKKKVKVHIENEPREMIIEIERDRVF